MHQEKYSLTWNTYSDHLKTMMQELMMNEDFADVTIVTEDKKHIKANINILSACSPVFRDILKKEKNSNQIIYLRGIQFSEMESIMQFIYLGEATFYEERMDEFIAVAKSLEIKELCNAETESNDEPDEPSPSNSATGKEMEEHTVISDPDHTIKQAPQQIRRGVVSVNGKYECEMCHKKYSDKKGLTRHNQSVHEGVKYACDQCDYQATQQSSLFIHIEAKHDGIKYPCDQCDYQATTKCSLTKHIQSMHEGVKYACNQCDYQATEKSNLYKHIRSIHEGIKYVCDQCDYRSSGQKHLRIHINNKH